MEPKKFSGLTAQQKADTRDAIRGYKVISLNLIGNPIPQNSGLLVIGETYLIENYQDGDDFTNVGAAGNFNTVEFVATGTTPNNWSNSSLLKTGLTPQIEIVENTITSNLEFIRISEAPGDYEFYSDDFNTDKMVLISSIFKAGGVSNMYWDKISSKGLFIYISTNGAGCDTFGSVHLEIRLYS